MHPLTISKNKAIGASSDSIHYFCKHVLGHKQVRLLFNKLIFTNQTLK